MNLVDNSGNVISDSDFRTNYPYTSFPATLTQDVVGEFGYNILQETPTPPRPNNYISLTQGPPALSNGVWSTTWVQTPIPLAQAQAAQAAVLNSACAAQIVAGFTCSALGAAYTYPSGLVDQQNLAASITDSQLAQSAPGWTANAEVVQTALGVPCSIITVDGTAYMCTQSGTCGSVAPTWSTQPGVAIADGTAVWQVWTTEFWCASNNNGLMEWTWQSHTADQIQMVGRVGKATIMAYQAKNAVLQAQLMSDATTTVDAVAAITWF